MNKNIFSLLVILFLTILTILLGSIDVYSERIMTSISTLSTIGGSIIGGMVAFWVAKMQIDANRNIEKSKERKIEKNICLLVIIDLEDMIKRFELILKQEERDEASIITKLKKSIIADSLIKFKNEFIYLIEKEENIKSFTSVVNRLILLLESQANESIDADSLEHLIKSCKKVKTLFESLLEEINTV